MIVNEWIPKWFSKCNFAIVLSKMVEQQRLKNNKWIYFIPLRLPITSSCVSDAYLGHLVLKQGLIDEEYVFLRVLNLIIIYTVISTDILAVDISRWGSLRFDWLILTMLIFVVNSVY